MSKKKIRINKKKHFDPKKLKDDILSTLATNPTKAYSSKQLILKLRLKDQSSKAAVVPILQMLERQNTISKTGRGYKTANEPDYVKGKIDHVNHRFAYLIPEDGSEDIWIKTSDLNYAFDGDLVKASVYATSGGRRPEGKVIQILERGKEEIVGRIEFSPRYAFVIPDNRKMYQDFFIRMDDAGQAGHNDKVIVKIKSWPARDKSAEGKVIRVLGKAGEHNAEIHSIMAEFDLPFSFSEEVESEADAIGSAISKSEIKKRKDFRGVTTFTIDPEDAKDFDDALSFKKLSNGNFEIGVHIADVTHYVRPKTMLEREGKRRATSVYLVDRTIPMLPEKISNELCSLRPNEDKLTFSAVFELGANGHILKEWFGRTIIHSDKRFSYEQAQEVIESKKGDFAEEILTLNSIALNLKDKRFKKGAVNFETTEVKFQLAEDGTALGIVPRERKDAHKLIEEFMLLANKRVAQFVFDIDKKGAKNTFVYRTHDYPDPEKIQNFSEFAKRFGHDLEVGNSKISSSLNDLLNEIEGTPEQGVLQSLAIRSMAKAKYTTAAEIHFGLAFQHYTHFTSPIRRYPDMMVHRLLQDYLDGKKAPEKEGYEEQCLHSSSQEKVAADAERASIKFKQVEFMRNAEDKAYDGIVSGVTEWGIFVEITETKCEGMVRLSELKDDHYDYDEKHYRIIGRKNKRIITLGNEVQVRVIGTDIDRRTIDLTFA